MRPAVLNILRFAVGTPVVFLGAITVYHGIAHASGLERVADVTCGLLDCAIALRLFYLVFKP